jgi:hypothetical protein
MTDRPKLIYLARRHMSIAAPDFIARWRQHGRLGMSLPRWRNIWRYAQCDVVPTPASPLPVAAGYDGVGLVWYRNTSSRASHVDDADRAVMARDESETFDRPVRASSVVVRERLLSPMPEDGFKLFRFLFVRPGAAIEALDGRRVELLARTLRDLGGGAGYAFNLAQPDTAVGAGLGCGAVDEIGFGSLVIAKRLLTPRCLGAVIDAEASAIESVTTVLTRETVLYRAEEPTAVAGVAE